MFVRLSALRFPISSNYTTIVIRCPEESVKVNIGLSKDKKGRKTPPKHRLSQPPAGSGRARPPGAPSAPVTLNQLRPPGLVVLPASPVLPRVSPWAQRTDLCRCGQVYRSAHLPLGGCACHFITKKPQKFYICFIISLICSKSY